MYVLRLKSIQFKKNLSLFKFNLNLNIFNLKGSIKMLNFFTIQITIE